MFAEQMRSLDTLNSFHNNQNILWDNAPYSVITETRSYGIASNEMDFEFNQISLFRW